MGVAEDRLLMRLQEILNEDLHHVFDIFITQDLPTITFLTAFLVNGKFINPDQSHPPILRVTYDPPIDPLALADMNKGIQINVVE